MKKQFLILMAGLLVTGAANAQLIPQMDYVKPQYFYQSPINELTMKAGVGLFEKKVNGTWRNESRMTGIQDAQGNQKVFASEKWDTIGNAWVFEMKMTQDISYNTSSKPTSCYFVLYQAGAKFMSRSQTITYDGTGKYNPIQSVDSVFNPTPMALGGVDSIVYDGSGRVSQRVSARIVFGSYQLSTRYKYTYDVAGKLIEFLEEDYSSSGGGSWGPQNKTTFTYNAAGKILTQVKSEYNDPNWDFAEMDSFGYDAGGNCTSFTQYNSTGTVWTPDNRQLFTNTGDNITEMIEQSWTGSAWLNESKAVISYSGAMPTGALIYPWTGSAWDTDYNERVNFNGGASGLIQVGKDQLEFYPNPASENLTLVGIENAGTVSVYDLQGKLLVQENVNPTLSTVHVGGLEAGIYVLTVQNEGKVFSTRFVKQ